MVVVLLVGFRGGIGSSLLDCLLADGHVEGRLINGLLLADVLPDPGRRDEIRQELAQKAASLPSDALLVSDWNATDVASTQQLVRQIEDRFGWLDVLLIASGIGFHGVTLDTPLETLAKVTPALLSVNATGPILLIRGCLPLMVSAHPGRQLTPKLMVMSSISGYVGLPSRSIYCASKFALNGFIETLALELKDAHKAVQIVLVCPVTVQTNFRAHWQQLFGAASAAASPSAPPASGVTADACAAAIWATLHTSPVGLHRLFVPPKAQLGYHLLRLPLIGPWMEGYMAARARL